jgi:hypothetical protein
MRGIHIILAMMPDRPPEAITMTLDEFVRALRDPTIRDIYDSAIRDELDREILDRVRRAADQQHESE